LVFNRLLDPELMFYSDEAWFTLKNQEITKITNTGAQKILMFFMKCHYII
jgi:hypothetical protein